MSKIKLKEGDTIITKEGGIGKVINISQPGELEDLEIQYESGNTVSVPDGLVDDSGFYQIGDYVPGNKLAESTMQKMIDRLTAGLDSKKTDLKHLEETIAERRAYIQRQEALITRLRKQLCRIQTQMPTVKKPIKSASEKKKATQERLYNDTLKDIFNLIIEKINNEDQKQTNEQFNSLKNDITAIAKDYGVHIENEHS